MQQNDIALLRLQAPGVAVGGKTRFPLLDKVIDGAYLTPMDNGLSVVGGQLGTTERITTKNISYEITKLTCRLYLYQHAKQNF